MGRPPTRDTLREQRCRFATLIGAELDAGQRPSGPYKGRIRPWKAVEFAKAVKATEQAVATWRHATKPVVPLNIHPILRAFYGDDRNQEFAEARATMKQAYDEAGGNTDVGEDTWTIVDKTMIAVANPVALSVNQPVTDNANGTMRLPFTLQFRQAKARKIAVRLNAKVVETTFDLALKEAWLSVKSPKWQPTEGSLFRAKDKSHPRVGGRFGNALKIVPGPGETWLTDEPLSDEPSIPLEIENPAGAETVTVAVAAEESAFDLTVRPPPRNLRQSDVIAAILRTASRRDEDDRIEIESKTVQP